MSVRLIQCYYFCRFRFVSLFGRVFFASHVSCVWLADCCCCCRTLFAMFACFFFFFLLLKHIRSSLWLWFHTYIRTVSQPQFIRKREQFQRQSLRQFHQSGAMLTVQTNNRTTTMKQLAQWTEWARERLFFFVSNRKEAENAARWWWWWCGVVVVVIHDEYEYKKMAAKYEKKTRKCEDREINNLNEWKTENNS